ILARLWWKLDRALTLEDVRYSALALLVDAVRHGCTTMIDHHASPNAVAGSLDAIGEAVQASGLRACLCYEVTDRDGPAVTQAGIEENVRWLRRCHEQRDPQLAGTFGLHAALTLSDESLAQAVEAARSLPFPVGFHIHAAEGPADQVRSQANYKKRVIHRLHEAGILGERTIVAHAITIDESERELLAETGTWVSHQPRSNMNNAVGVAAIPAMLQHPSLGRRVCLGNDGFSFNMFQEMKVAYLLHKVATNDPRTLGGDEVMRMAYRNNAALASLFFERPVGRLAVGAHADIMLCDYQPFTPLTGGNLPWHILFGLDGSHVTDTIGGGRLLMQDRQILTLDEAAITQQAMILAQDVWKRFAT
nr:amidohydrolase family protein [Ardenticatenales bacterium]